MSQELEGVEATGAEAEGADATGADAGFTAAIGRVSAEVLETMFFSEAVAAECEHTWFSSATSVRVGFEGSHTGEMRLAVSGEAVPTIAAAFLGLDAEETSEVQRSQVMLELANILCGAVLSSLWPESRLLLDAPALTLGDSEGQQGWHCCLALEEGRVAISIRLAALNGTPEPGQA